MSPAAGVGAALDPSPDDDLALAIAAVDAADAVSLPGYAARAFRVERKADASEVTEVDRATETAIVDVLRAARPDDAVWGEEHGETGPAGARRRWIIDPIDGTSNFVRGVPVWASLVALVVDDAPVVGVVSAPAMGSRWWARRGAGAWRTSVAVPAATRLWASGVDALAAASVSVTFSPGWDRAGATPRLVELVRTAARARGVGDFWQHMLVAEGAMDLAVDAWGLQPYDVAALVPILEEAGAAWSDHAGARSWRGPTLLSWAPSLPPITPLA
ncbi:MAG: histidinol-phosphate phosphatase [Actinomycetota bacterium]